MSYDVRIFYARRRKKGDKWLFAEPVTKEQLAEHRKHLAEHTKGQWVMPEVGGLTCDGCALAPTCTLVFDAYNTNGDCLLSK